MIHVLWVYLAYTHLTYASLPPSGVWTPSHYLFTPFSLVIET